MSLIQFPSGIARPIVTPAAPARQEGEQAPQRNPRGELVMRAIALLREHVNEPVSVARLSELTGASERTLRAAFHDVLGLSPKQFAIAQRLRAAREALVAADPKTTTVTDIATAYGFFELGRFAGRYREVFGEAPSQTLQHMTGRWSGEVA